MSSFHALWSTGGLVGAATGGLLAAQEMKPPAHFGFVALSFGVAVTLIFPHLLNAPERRAGDPEGREHNAIFPFRSRGLLALGTIALCIMIGEGAMRIGVRFT
jgi:hypothetical protein